MATIEKRYNRAGKFTHYRISVAIGVTPSGAPIRHRMNWTPAPGMTERQIKKAVEAEANKFEDQLRNGYFVDSKATFEEYSNYVINLKIRAEKLTPRTADRYLSLLARVNASIGALKVTDIRPSHLNKLYEDLSKEGIRKDSERAMPKPALNATFKRSGLSKGALARKANCAPSTIRVALEGSTVTKETADKIASALDRRFSELFRLQNDSTPLANKTILEHHRVISSVLAQAEKEMIVMFNAASKATPPKANTPDRDYFQPDELNQILDALESAPLKWKTATYILIDTGCRRGELMGLMWDRINLEEGIITIDKALLYSPSLGVYIGPPKNKHVRSLRIAPETLALLTQLKAAQEEAKETMGDRWVDSGFVFVSDNGSRMDPSSISGWLNKFSEENGLPHIHPHAFRHTAASNMIANGVDLVTTAAELGHANASTTTTIYAHQISVARARATNVRGEVFRRRNPVKEVS